MTLPLVLVIGATGSTGRSIVAGLLKSASFRVAAMVRPSSSSKSEVADLRAQGVEIRFANMQSDSVDTLKAVLSGVDILISAVFGMAVLDQKPILTIAKEIGIKRVVPCDFATPGARGVRDLMDAKLDIRTFVQDLGVNYTFIDVGWWMQLILPCSLKSKASVSFQTRSREFFGLGDKKNLVTNLKHIGDYVARIIEDERTVNHYVIVWEDEVTLEEAFTIGEEVSGDGQALRTKRIYLSVEDILRRIAEGKSEAGEEGLRSKSGSALFKWTHYQYAYSLHVLSENTLASAKEMGALDVHELYPDMVPMKLQEYAKEFYHDLEYSHY
ncbi:hypothetical protein AcV7_004551 [Taiwanofungus camphoratus]|nr:hypothetical protein AcV7_004551 [Antrodia cinnamomea]